MALTPYPYHRVFAAALDSAVKNLLDGEPLTRRERVVASTAFVRLVAAIDLEGRPLTLYADPAAETFLRLYSATRADDPPGSWTADERASLTIYARAVLACHTAALADAKIAEAEAKRQRDEVELAAYRKSFQERMDQNRIKRATAPTGAVD